MKTYRMLCPACSTPSNKSSEFRDTIEKDGVITCVDCGFKQGIMLVSEKETKDNRTIANKKTYTVVPLSG